MKTNYMKVIKLTDEEQVKLYMKCEKKELAEMLTQANKAIQHLIDRTNSKVKLDAKVINFCKEN